MLRKVVGYFASLPPSRLVLWCYAVWYGVVLSMYFDASLRVWLTALGVSFVIGIALNLSVARVAGGPADRWQTMRLFLMPFCVSSYSSLIKDRDFLVVVPRDPRALAIAVGSCAMFLAAMWVVRRTCAQSVAQQTHAASQDR